tara:strand:- start:668 stop:859 length:192 start_codon:yes stop_codon:yes gene_type:complete
MFGRRQSFFTWRGGVNPIQIAIILGAYFISNNIDSGWSIFFKLIALFFFINLFRTISWWLKRW